MAVLFKVPPPLIETEDLVEISGTAYAGATVAAGDRAFLWWSETRGGAGLAACGIVVEATKQGSVWKAKVRVSSEVNRTLGKGQLAPLRDSMSSDPEASLARKLYRHSLNKVTSVNPQEEAFLDTFFV